MSSKIEIAYQIPLDSNYSQIINKSFEAFGELALKLYPHSTFAEKYPDSYLTDCPVVSQLQDLFYLLEKGIIEVEETESPTGQKSILLKIVE